MMRPVAVAIGLFLWAALGVAREGAAQQLDPAQQKVLDELREARELNDVRAMERIVQRNKEVVVQIYEELEGQATYSDSIELWEEIKEIARLLDQAEGTNAWSLRAAHVSKMSLDDRLKRQELRAQYVGLRAILRQIAENRDKLRIKEVEPQVLELAEKFGQLGDPEFQAYTLSELASAYKELDRQLDAVKLWDKVDEILTRAGYDNFNFHQQVRQIRDSLKKQGFDPNAAPGERAVARGNTATSWADDAEGRRYSDPIPLRYREDEKLPGKFVTPATQSSENTAKWPFFVLNGNGPVPFSASFKPLGQSFQVKRDGIKITCLVEGQDPIEFRCISKPTLVRMRRTIQTVSGENVDLRYAWLAATGGDQESRFGLQLNASPQADQMAIRYHPACYLKGKVLGLDVTILDDNFSGRFGDPRPARDPTSALQPEYTWTDAMIVGRSKVAVPFSEFLYANDAFYRVKLQEDYTVRTRKLAVDTGKVKLKFHGRVKPQLVVIEELKEFRGAFFAIGERDWTIVPVGEYRVGYGVIRKGKGNNELSCAILPGKSVAFRVEKDEEVVVELGAPFRFDFEKEVLPNGDVKIVGKSVVVYGRSGELYHRFWDEPPIPDKVSMRVKGGGRAGKPQKMKRATFEDYRQDGLSVWSPLDLVMPGKPGQVYEVKLELKKHPLLGGPIESDWQ